jgi:holliday junction DNA helicase RuvA
MIGKLKGRIDSISEDSVLLDVGGVCYHVFCAGRTIAALPEAGAAAELIIETHVREDHIHLFGFPDLFERDWFRLLMTVQGVGVKMALAILNVFSPAQLAQTIAAKDIKSLQRVSGVGAKLAERLTTELKSKVLSLPTGGAPITTAARGTLIGIPPASASEDALSALLNLGYTRAEAYNAVQKAVEKTGTENIGKIVTESLRMLAR